MAERRILNSWKEIASYLGRGVRTVQRWEAQLGLPVHRPAGRAHSAVLAFSNELDQWLDSRPVRRTPPSRPESIPSSGSRAVEIEALLGRVEVLLQRFESVVVRNEEMHRRLGLALEAQADRQVQQNLHNHEALNSISAEAA